MVVEALRLSLEPAALYAETGAELDLRWGEAALMPGAERLVRHLFAARVPLALATSTPRAALQLKRAALGDLYAAFGAVVCGDDVTAGKPAPEAYLAAAAALGVPAHACLAVEDAPSGVQSARAAGCAVLAVPSLPERARYAGERTTLLRSLLDVDLARWGLPPLRDWVGRALPLSPLMRLKGPVVRGFGRGSRLLGIPTANLDVEALGPAVAHAACTGIYLAWASVGPAPAPVHKAVMSIGWCACLRAGCTQGRTRACRRAPLTRVRCAPRPARNPHFKNEQKTVEPWLLHDFCGADFYGEELRLVVAGYIRPEAEFTTLEALRAQIHGDADVARAALELPPFAALRDDDFLRA